MREDNRIIDVTPGVKWIGILDPDIRVFDIVMRTEFGTTYNSYFINAEKKAVVELAKEKFSDAYLSKLRRVTDLDKIDYIIFNHTEPDHSGSMRQLVDLAPQATVVGSGNAIRYLADIVNKPFKSLVVKDGDTLDLGNKTLKFISAPNLHWPDTIFTYLEEDKILFTCDCFGAHFCPEEIFDDRAGDYNDSFKYYFDTILKPYSRFMLKAIEKIAGLDIALIATGHGPILRSGWKKAVEQSKQLAEEYLALIADKGEKRMLVTYVSAYGYTREMAELIAAGASSVGNVTVDLMDIENAGTGDMDSKMTIADGVLIGSPTINQNTLLPVYRMFSIISPLRDKGKLAAAFGSYGWSGEAPRIITEILKNLKLTIFGEPAAVKFASDKDKELLLRQYGERFARQLVSGSGEI